MEKPLGQDDNNQRECGRKDVVEMTGGGGEQTALEESAFVWNPSDDLRVHGDELRDLFSVYLKSWNWKKDYG